jgi:hypothetical protein
VKYAPHVVVSTFHRAGRISRDKFVGSCEFVEFIELLEYFYDGIFIR